MMSMNTKQAAAAAKSGYSTKELVLDAMFIALTYVFTAFVNVRLPIAANGGLIHFGKCAFVYLCHPVGQAHRYVSRRFRYGTV